MVTEEEMVELIIFTKDVFNYYNGRINRNNLAVLQIDMVYRYHNILADSGYPNIIYFHIMQFINVKPVMERNYQIMYSIIHELYHMDQKASFLKYIHEEKHHDYTESVVNFMTSSYILNHKIELREKFGLFIEFKNQELLNIMHSTSAKYERCTLVDHICRFVDNMFTVFCDPYYDEVSEITENIRKYMDIPQSNIWFKINDDIITIKNMNYVISRDRFNGEIYRTMYTMNQYTLLDIEEKYDDIQYALVIKVKGGIVMASKLQKGEVK